MVKFIKSDYVIAVILFGTWVFYLMYDGSTRFDINPTITLPLLAAADFTALGILYVMGRYYTAKKKGGVIGENINKLISDGQTEQAQDESQDEVKSDNKKS